MSVFPESGRWLKVRKPFAVSHPRAVFNERADGGNLMKTKLFSAFCQKEWYRGNNKKAIVFVSFAIFFLLKIAEEAIFYLGKSCLVTLPKKRKTEV